MPSVQAGDSMRAWGSRYARLVLEKSERNKRQACDVLDISYHTLNAYLNYQPRDRRLSPLPPRVLAEAPSRRPRARARGGTELRRPCTAGPCAQAESRVPPAGIRGEAGLRSRGHAPLDRRSGTSGGGSVS